MNIVSVPLLLSMMTGPLYGKLELQDPASDFYYARDAGEVASESAALEGHKVFKGQKLIEYIVLDSNESRSLYSKSDGYIEFVTSGLLAGEPLSKGQLLFIVTLYEVFGKYEALKGTGLPSILVGSHVWVCNDQGSWKFLVNEIKNNRVLLSASLDQKDFERVNKASKQEQMSMFLEKDQCKKSNI